MREVARRSLPPTLAAPEPGHDTDDSDDSGEDEVRANPDPNPREDEARANPKPIPNLSLNLNPHLPLIYPYRGRQGELGCGRQSPLTRPRGRLPTRLARSG